MSEPVTPAFTRAERRIVASLNAPEKVQRFLNRLPYNYEPSPPGATLRSLRSVLRAGRAHCLEAALAAAAILEQHGWPPRLMSFESVDGLDHVLYVYQAHGRWGAIGRSRDPGLHGRRPVFRTARALALSYVEPYVDFTGRITGYAVVDLAIMGNYDWRLATTNRWKVERTLLDYPHHRLHTSDRRIDALRRRYVAFIVNNPGRKPVAYRGRKTWSELPEAFRR